MPGTANNETTRELRDFLANPATYKVRSTVEVIETHISYVFLVGEQAYKLKKPVKFDFLDFSTVTKRKDACEAEVALNRRMSPKVYLGVLPVRRNSDGVLTLDDSDSGKVVDWLVHMRRLKADRMLTNRLCSSDAKAKATDIRKVAEFLAEYYSSQAPVTISVDHFQSRRRQHIEDNQWKLLALADSSEVRAQICRIHQAQLRFLISHSDLLASRVLDGRIVEGHGDLRPDHVYIYNSPLVIDCIEFNREYRLVDVIDELAFLAACCDRFGEPTVGESIFAAYEQQSGDICNPQLVAFYKSYRACVRAKVAGLRQEQVESENGGNRQKEKGYLDLAESYVRSFDRPIALIVGGLMGSGKSTLAHSLQKTFACPLISSDAIRRNANFETASGISQDNDFDYGVGKYATKARIAIYKDMVARAESMLSISSDIIFDATFSTQETRQLVVDFAKSHDFHVLQIQCECPRDEAIRRIWERNQTGESDSEARPEHYDHQVAEYEPPLSSVPVACVDTTQATTKAHADAVAAFAKVLTAPVSDC